MRLVSMQDGKVRLGIAAPREVRVLRRELVAAGAVLLTPGEHAAEMREAGSRRFVRRAYEPPMDLGSVPPLDVLAA